MHFLRYLVILIFGVSVVGCHRNPIDNQLQLAESIMEQHPDSALTILQAIDGTALKGETQALHALLLSQAYDKNYIDLTDDSLISIATNYYLSSSDTHHKMLAHYYRSVVNANAGNYEVSLMDALQANDLATDPINIARITSMLARLYRARYNYLESIKWGELSLNNSVIVGKTNWIYDSYYGLGLNYLEVEEYDKVLACTDSMQLMVGYPNENVNKLRYYAYFFLDRNHEADSIYILMGEPEEFSRHQAIIHSNDLDSQTHISLLNDLIKESNEFMLNSQISNLNGVYADFEKNKRILLNDRLKQQHQIFLYVVLCSFLSIALLVAIILIFRSKAKVTRLKIENDFALLSKEYESVKLRLNSQESHQEDLVILNRDISLLFLQKFSWIDYVGNIYIDASIKNEKKDDLIYKKIASMMDRIKDNDLVTEIDSALKGGNYELWNEINNFGLNPTEKNLLYYFLSGVSTRVLCVVMDKTPAAIYNIKSRVKKKLRLINTPTALYLHDII